MTTRTDPCPHRSSGGPCLSCQTSARLAAAGITPDDPALAEIAKANLEARFRRELKTAGNGK
jgi:hypothetical protein